METAVVNPAPDVRQQVEAVRPRPHFDKQIWGIYFFLVIISIIELYSASSREVRADNILGPLIRHVMLLGGGTAVMWGLQRIHYRVYYNLTWLIVGLCIAATIYTMFWGDIINGTRRSFSLFGICSVQPSELLKFAAALVIARILCHYTVKYHPGHREEERTRNRWMVGIVAVIVLLFSALIVKQGLTNTILLLAIALSLMLIAGVSWGQWLTVVLIYAVLGGGYGLYKLASHSDATERTELISPSGGELDRTQTRMNRISDWLRSDKYLDPITSDNQQEQYSYMAQANGGVLGVFPGNSRETARLPLAFSDYIYAIIIEDGGLFGGLVVMVLYLLLLARAGRIAMKCKKVYPALLVLGMAVFIVCQALMHMGIVSGFLPVSGQPLPLISKGGSSVIVTSIALGIMLSVSRYAQRKGKRAEMRDQLQALNDDGTVDAADANDNPSQI